MLKIINNERLKSNNEKPSDDNVIFQGNLRIGQLPKRYSHTILAYYVARRRSQSTKSREVIAKANANEKGLACAKRAAAYSIAVQEQA